MRKVTLFFLPLLAGLTVPALLFGQTGTVAGKVTSTTGEALPGANVVVQIQALTLGAATDVNGTYTITNVPAGNQKITARFIGYRSDTREVNVAVGKITEVNFELSPTVLPLDEVVVTGAGAAVERMKLGNTVSTINSTNLEAAPVTTLAEILQGRVPGVASLPSGGLVGEGAQIRIRGSASLSQLNEPIVYIDGVRVGTTQGFANVGAGGGGEPSRLDDINPDAIERVEILKGAAAATLYGTQANAGVIQIFTKQGAQTKPKFNFEIQQSALQYPPKAYKPNVGFARDSATAANLSTIFGTTITPFVPFEREFVKSIIGTGYGQTYSGSVSGGGSGINYFGSLRYSDVNGPFDPKPEAFFGKPPGGAQDRVRRGQFSANISMVPTEALRLRLSTQYTNARQETIENNNNIYSPITSAQFGKPERVRKTGVGGATSDNAFGNAAFQTVREGLYQETKDATDHGNVSLAATYNVMPELSLDATVGLDYISQRSSNFNPFGWNVDRFVTADVNGALAVGTRQRQEWTVDLKALWNTNFASDLSSQLIVGMQGFRSVLNSQVGTGSTFPGPGIEVLGAGQTQTSGSSFSDVIQAGVVAQEQLGYKDYMYLTVGARFDANSAFGTAFKTATYPKASVSFLPLKAFDMASAEISTLRLRAAIGQSGQQPGAFDKFTTYGAIRAPDGSGLAPGNLGNQNLKPEVATEVEFGTEVALFEDRIGIELTVWNRTVKDALIARQFAPSGGFSATQLDNIGELKANGLDISLNLNLIRGEDFSLSMFANGAYLKEEIKSMGGAPPLKVGGSYPRYRNFIKEGYAPGAFFGPKLSTEAIPFDTDRNGQPDDMATLLAYFATTRDPSLFANGLVRIIGPDGKPYTPALGNQNLSWIGANPNATAPYYLDHYLGKPMPDWSGSFGLNMTLVKNVRIAALFEYKFGEFYVHNLTDAFRRQHPTIGRNIHGPSELEAILVNPASTAQQRVDAALEWAKKYLALSPYDGLNEIEKIYMVRWRELSVTYDIPAEYSGWFGVGNMSISFAGRNIALWTDYTGIDPETNVYSFGGGGTFGNNFGQGIEAFGVPIARQYVFTLKFGL